MYLMRRTGISEPQPSYRTASASLKRSRPGWKPQRRARFAAWRVQVVTPVSFQ